MGARIIPVLGPDLLVLEEGVRAARDAGAPVVALESTIITHGMPYPENMTTALAVEAIVRAAGATPATIAVIDGIVRVGLDRTTLDRLAARTDAQKISRRDLAAIIVRKGTGGTTVAATMLAAAAAGIAVFATGGIGGVHRGASETFDISADLSEFTRTPVAVVCAGAKSILDLGKTLEYLETHGVPVLGYQTDDFPAFFTRSSGHRVDVRFDTARELAAVIAMHRHIDARGGIIIANPISAQDEMPATTIESLIAQAVSDADEHGISRKALTPYLLARVNELTGGASLTANIALVKNNALLASQIAIELADLR